MQLHTSGNLILNSNGCTVVLKGTDVDSLEYTPSGASGGPSGVSGAITFSVNQAVSVWGANIIRLPLSQDFWFGCSNSKGTPASAAAYQNLVSAIVAECSNLNAYVILDLHWSGTQTGATSPCGTGWGNATAQQYMPDDNSVTFWTSVASMFANNPAVLFDLYNEPYDYQPDGWSIWLNGGTEATYGYHTPGMQMLLNTVRATGADNVIVAGGLDYAYDLSGIAGGDNLTDTVGGNGVIYSSHIYPSKGNNPWIPANGDSVISPTAANYPVIIGEFGQGNSISGYTPNPDTNGTWDQTLLGWINGNNAINYKYSATAWDMNAYSPPCLIGTDWVTPTSYHGVPVSQWLATPVPQCSPVPTVTPTPTATATATPTVTNTPGPNTQPMLYPNPATSTEAVTLDVPFLSASKADIKVYSLSFRLVQEEQSGPFQFSDQLIPLVLTDRKGNRLANGLYYVVVNTNQGKTILKMLILR